MAAGTTNHGAMIEPCHINYRAQKELQQIPVAVVEDCRRKETYNRKLGRVDRNHNTAPMPKLGRVDRNHNTAPMPSHEKEGQNRHQRKPPRTNHANAKGTRLVEGNVDDHGKIKPGIRRQATRNRGRRRLRF